MSDPRCQRGYYGIGIVLPKYEVNIGTLCRSAYAFGASFIFTIGERYKKQNSDTTKSWRHIPILRFSTEDECWRAIPYDCVPIGIERSEMALDLPQFAHPQRAVYFLGPEDGNLPTRIAERCKVILNIPSVHCLNVSVAGSVVLYDRVSKTKQVER